MEEIKVSVLIPVYNVEKYLRRCLKSVVEQNFRDIEIIIVNDASPDNSLSIIREFEKNDSRIKVVNKEKNEGLSNARNTALEMSRGKYILHIDSDDWIEQGYIKALYEKAEETGADIVVSDYYIDYDNGNIKYKIDQYVKENEENKEIFLKNLLLAKDTAPCVWNKLLKRDLYLNKQTNKQTNKQLSIYHPGNVALGEDLFVIPKLFYFSHKIVKINKAYIHYIQNKKSITKSKNLKKVKDIYIVIKELENFFSDKEQKYIDYWEIGKVSHLMYQLIDNNSDFDDEEYVYILNDFFEMSKKHKLQNNNRSIRLFYFLRKYFSDKTSFRISQQLRNIYIFLKSFIKAN